MVAHASRVLAMASIADFSWHESCQVRSVLEARFGATPKARAGWTSRHARALPLPQFVHLHGRSDGADDAGISRFARP